MGGCLLGSYGVGEEETAEDFLWGGGGEVQRVDGVVGDDDGEIKLCGLIEPGDD